MKKGTQIALIVLGFMAMAWLYWSVNMQGSQKKSDSSVTNSNNSEKKELNFEDEIVEDKITNIKEKPQKTSTVNYKDVFKEPKEVQSEMEKIVERDELKKLDEEVDALISEADSLIKKKGLTVEKPEIDDLLRQEQQEAIENLEKKLNKLKTK